MTHINIAALEVGQVIGKTEFLLTRDSLVRYAGASGDFNSILYRDDVAVSVGLPGVLAHGMLTMGVAVQVVVDWVGDAGRVERDVNLVNRTGVIEVTERLGSMSRWHRNSGRNEPEAQKE